MALTTWDGNTVTTKLDPLTMSMPEPADEDYFWKKMGTIVQRLRPQNPNPVAPIQRQALSAPPPPQRPPMNLPRERMSTPLDYEEQMARIAQARAAYQTPAQAGLLRWTPGGFNNPSHLEMADQLMNPFQRQAYLPGSSQVTEGGRSPWERINEETNLLQRAGRR